MKSLLPYLIAIACFVSWTGFAQIDKTPSFYLVDSCKVNFTPSVSEADLESLVREFNQHCVGTFQLDQAINIENINFKRLPEVYDPQSDIIPSIEQHYGVPAFQIGGYYSQFGGRFKLSNLAFYEANRNSILSSGYESFPSFDRNF